MTAGVRRLGITCVAAAFACSTGEATEPSGAAGNGGASGNGGSAGSDAMADTGVVNAGNAGTLGADAMVDTSAANAGNAGVLGGDAGGPETVTDAGADAPEQRFSYAAETAAFLNPERGFYTYASLTSGDSFDSVRAQGKTLVYTNVELQDYLGDDHEQDLPQALLNDVQDGFDAVRNARLKVIVRFRYDDGAGYPGGTNDAPENWIVRHIEQLTPLLTANEDVLFLLQAGFIGAWGEWHTSNNFADGRVPSAAALGTWRVALWLPDQAQSLRELPEYAIRTEVSADAPGDAADGVENWSLISES